jgi:D-methionine transport system substrate-binding protein
MKTKKRRFVALAVVLTVALLSLLISGCTQNNSTTDNTGTNGQKTVLKVGASVTPHAEILNNIKSDLADEGYDLQIIEYTDYVKPDLDTANGDTIANYFQHKPYLDDFNLQNKTDLVSVAAIHFEPLAIYPGKTESLDSLPDGAKIAIPNDTTNEARALQLIAAQGFITLPEGAGLDVTPKDIVSNPKNIQFIEMDAAAVPRSLQEVDLGVINGNNALAANLDLNSVLVAEDPNSEAAQTYANILVVAAGHEDDPGIQALVKALTSDKTRQFIEDNYNGAVVPVF